MIELRWLVSPRNDVDRVLQYREGGYPYASRATGESLDEWHGTHWQNVPEVTASHEPQKELDK